MPQNTPELHSRHYRPHQPLKGRLIAHSDIHVQAAGPARQGTEMTKTAMKCHPPQPEKWPSQTDLLDILELEAKKVALRNKINAWGG